MARVGRSALTRTDERTPIVARSAPRVERWLRVPGLDGCSNDSHVGIRLWAFTRHLVSTVPGTL